MTVNLSEVRFGVGVAGCGHDDHLARTLESVDAVLAEVGAQPVARVLATAEGSTKAEQIAAQHGWSFRRISAAQPRTLAAAREAARRAAGGDATLLVDGDVAISAGWLMPAVEQLAANDRLAGVGGVIDESHWDRQALVRGRRDVYGTGAGGPARELRDVTLWRRAVVDSVGGFDPWLPSEDEAELAGRLSAAGFGLWNMGMTAGARHGVPRDSMADVRRFVKGGAMSGPGAVLRRSKGTMTFARHIGRYRGPLLLFAWVIFGGAVAIAGWNLGVGTIWLWATLGLLAFFAVLMQSLPRAFWRGVRSLAVATSVVRALIIPAGGTRLGSPPRPLPPPKGEGEGEEEGEELAQAAGGGMPFRGAPRDPDDPPPLVAQS